MLAHWRVAPPGPRYLLDQSPEQWGRGQRDGEEQSWGCWCDRGDSGAAGKPVGPGRPSSAPGAALRASSARRGAATWEGPARSRNTSQVHEPRRDWGPRALSSLAKAFPRNSRSLQPVCSPPSGPLRECGGQGIAPCLLFLEIEFHYS